MTKNQYQMATGALSTKVAIASFLGGTLLLLMYFYFKENIYLYLVGALYLIITTLINLVFLLNLLHKAFSYKNHQQYYFVKIGIVIANIPIAFLYSQIVLSHIPFN